MRLYERNGRGSIPHFGAFEENGEDGFPELKRMMQRVNERAFCVEIAVVLKRRRRDRWNLVEWAAGISTVGAQEMQKSCESRVASCGTQYSVRVPEFGRADDFWEELKERVCGERGWESELRASRSDVCLRKAKEKLHKAQTSLQLHI